MLVLSRQKNESIIISLENKDGKAIEVEVMISDVRGGKVRLGINAPREVQVHRLEIWEIIKREKEERKKEQDIDPLGR